MKSAGPTIPGGPQGRGFEETVEGALTMLIGRCTQAFEVLPLVKDVEILRSVLYSGVWAKYVSVQQKARRSLPSGGGKKRREAMIQDPYRV